MIDRLLALLLALTVAVPALTRPACCCVTSIGGTAGSCETGTSDLPACCQAKTKVPTCCRSDAGAGLTGDVSQKTIAPFDTRCGCEGCLSRRPAQPLAATPAAPRPPSLEDLPEALGEVAARPPIDRLLSAGLTTVKRPLSLGQPPPDRQAILCVWTI